MMLYAIILLGAVALCLIFAYLIAPARGGDLNALLGRDFAHRGLYDNAGDAPENSLRAFERACEAGYGIELDVRWARDGVVVFHDDRLTRLCETDAFVRDMTVRELGEVSLCGTDQGAPTFWQVLELVNGRVPVIVEIKSDKEVRALTRAVVETLEGYPGAYCIESFNPFAMSEARKRAPGIARGQLVAAFSATRRDVGAAAALILSNLLLNAFSRPHFIARDVSVQPNIACRLVKRMGAQTALWTLRTSEDYKFAQPGDMRIFESMRP